MAVPAEPSQAATGRAPAARAREAVASVGVTLRTLGPGPDDRSIPSDEAGALQRIEARVRQRLFASGPTATRIGRFLVLEPIGRGGMGMVYAAYDEQLDRKVAIKVLLEDELPGEKDRLRFQREARALARLSHPHVVTVHEVGESNGQIFLAMEHIRGQSLGAWLRTKPDWPQVLEAFIQAGRGLAAAHEAGLIHRDLKPANIMRSEDGVVKVLDFGLARATADELEESLDHASFTGSHVALPSSLTRTGVVMGTPAYMAPEQLEGRTVDARSDQYSFCLALWEGLTGQRLFEGSGGEELLAARLAGPPAWPDQAPPVPRVIVEALRRGLSPVPEGRWPAMDDLLRALSWDPKRRRSGWRAGLAVVGVLALGGAMAQAWSQARAQRCSGAREQLAGIWDDARRNEVEAAIVGVGPAYASDVWGRTQRELAAYADAWATMHTEACEATAVRGEQSPRVLDLRMSCLHRAAEDLRATVDTLADADADVVSNAHELVAGLRPLSRCADTEALEADVEPPLRAEAEAVEDARWQLARAKSLRSAGRYRAARAAVVAATTMLEGVEYGPVRTELMLERGRVLDDLSEYAASEEALLEAMQHASRWGQRELMADAAINLIHVVGFHRRRAEAIVLFRPLVQGLLDEDSGLEAEYRDALGAALIVQGRLGEAETEIRATLASHEQTLSPDHPAIVEARRSLGALLYEQGKFEEAEAEYRAALAIRTQALGPDHPAVATLRGRLARALAKQGRYDEAEAEQRAVLALFETSLGAGSPSAAKARNRLGVLLKDRGKHEEAEAELRAARAALERAQGPESSGVIAVRSNLANLWRAQGKYEEAEAEHRAVLALRTKTQGPDHPDVADSRWALARTLQAGGKRAEAEAEYRAALATKEKAMDPDHPSIAELRRALAEVWRETDPQGEALGQQR